MVISCRVGGLACSSVHKSEAVWSFNSWRQAWGWGTKLSVSNAEDSNWNIAKEDLYDLNNRTGERGQRQSSWRNEGEHWHKQGSGSPTPVSTNFVLRRTQFWPSMWAYPSRRIAHQNQINATGPFKLTLTSLSFTLQQVRRRSSHGQFSGVGWAFTGISATATEEEKRNKKRGWRSQCSDTSRCRRRRNCVNAI